MPSKVTFTVSQGDLPQPQYVFTERASCIIGRETDCDPRVPNDQEHQSISRLHCLVDVNPPDVRVRDFGSKFGTFVNGTKIGQRESEDQRGKAIFPEHDLNDGDEIRLGDPTKGKPVVFKVGVFVPARCAECSGEIPEDRKAAAQRSPGVYQCDACRKKAEALPRQEPPRQKAKVCAKCGKDVAAEMGEHRQGEFVCAACQAEPMQVMKRLLELARTGRKELLAIQGYEVLRELGRGGMGAVYLARSEKTGEKVALKVMLPKVAADERAREMFLREMENTRALDHSNVVRLRDGGCAQGTFFMVLEYCDGGSVDKWMEKRGGRLTVAEARPLVLQALAGLEYAHQAEIPNVKLADGNFGPGRGLVHRDLKPPNLFLAGAVAKVGDYGLAKSFDMAGLSGQTRTGSAAGTPYFMPRQQVVNFKYAQPEVDVWALAASFYFMLTGQVPRAFTTGKDPWQTVLQTEPVPIRKRNPAIPAKLAEVIDRALVDKPKIHFKTAAEFRRALEGVLLRAGCTPP